MIDEVKTYKGEAIPLPETGNQYQIDQRSELAQEIISQRPGFLERWALYLFLGILIFLLSLTWFIKYPDIIEAKAILTATNAPKELIIRQEGRLIRLLTHNKKKVAKSEILGLIESTANHQDVLQLSTKIDSCIALLNNDQFEKIIHCFSNHYNHLGEVQEPYRNFITGLQQLDDYTVNGFYTRKINMLRKDIETLEMTRQTTQRQLELTEQDMVLAEESYNMNKELFDERIIAKEEFRNEKSKFVNKKMAIPQLMAALLSNSTQKRDKLKEIDQLEHDFAQQKVLFQEALQSLKTVVDEWKTKYVIMAPVEGKIVLNVPLQENQFLQHGKTIGYIDPGHCNYFAEVNLPQTNLGKVDTGLQVQLRFSAYPYQEAGFVPGTINYVSEVATDSGFVATVRLNKGLVTNTNQRLVYKTGLQAQAIVITRNVRLMNRLFNNVLKFTSSSN